MKNKNDYIIPDNNKRSFDSIIHLFIYLPFSFFSLQFSGLAYTSKKVMQERKVRMDSTDSLETHIVARKHRQRVFA